MNPLPIAAALLVLMSSIGPSAAWADVIPDETHLTHEDATIQLGPWQDYTSWTYDVQRGDTLSEIAQHELGTMHRTKEILQLNPGLDANRLQPGRGLRMPPRKQPAAYDAAISADAGAPRAWWDFYVLPVLDDGESQPAPVDSGRRIPWHRDGATLFAIRHDHASNVLQAIAASPRRSADVLARFARDGVAATSPEVLGGRRLVDAHDDAHYGHTAYEVRGLSSGRIELVRGRRREFDENREALGVSASGFGALTFGLLTLGLGVVVALVLLVRRRGRGFDLPVSTT